MEEQSRPTSVDRSTEQYPRRLHALEERFERLFNSLENSPQKDALSVLHGMMHELWRQLRQPSTSTGDRGIAIDDIADLYRHAPKMEAASQSTPLAPGTAAPDFALLDTSGTPVHLSDFRGRTTVVVFYPLDWSPGCSQQLDLYQQELVEFERRSARVLAISVDSIYSHGAWAAVRQLKIPLLSDFQPKGDVARRYQVYREQDGFSDRALYIVDGEGMIRYSHVSPYLHHVPDIYEVFDELDAMKPAEVTS
jgi:peroxiredoxin